MNSLDEASTLRHKVAMVNQAAAMASYKVGNSTYLNRLLPKQQLLLMLRHSAESLNAQEERLATSPYLMIRLHLPHGTVLRLHMR